MFDDEGGAVVFLASFAAKVSASALQLGKIGSPTMDRRLDDMHSSSWSSQIPSFSEDTKKKTSKRNDYKRSAFLTMVTSVLTTAALRAKYLTNTAYARAFSTQRTVVVVGATSGIGNACAHRLAQQGFQVLAVGRHREGRAEELVQALTESSRENGTESPAHEFYSCDAFSLKSVQDTARQISQKHQSIDALVMTQGMATLQGFTPTPDGNDQKLTLHYYSRVAMAQCLLPALQKSNMPAVILSVLSGGVHGPYTKYEEDPSLQKNYSIRNAADAAGYYNDLGFDNFARRNSSLIVAHACPGFVNTNWGTEFPSLLRGFVRLLQPFGRSPMDCADYLLSATVLAQEAGNPLPDRPNGNTEGLYIVGQYGESSSLTKQHTPEARDSIWKHTVDVLGKAGIVVEP